MKHTLDFQNIRRKDYLTSTHGILNILHVCLNTGLLFVCFILCDIYASLILSFVITILASWIHQRFLSEMVHEAAHYNFVPNKKWNDFLGNWLMAYWHGYTVEAYRKAHMHHHAQESFFTEKDPDTFHLSVLSKQDLHTQLACDLCGFTALKNYWNVFLIGRENKIAPMSISSRLHNLFKTLSSVGVVHICLLTLSLISGLFLYYFLYMGTLITLYSFMNRVRLYGQHLTIKENGTVSSKNTHSSRTIAGNIFDRLFYSSKLMMYHHEHHKRPNLPYRALHRACPRNEDNPNEYMKDGRWSLLLKFYRDLPSKKI